MTGLTRPASVTPQNNEEDVNLEDMTKSELLEYASEHGVDGVSSRNTKAQIIAAIEG